MKILTFFLLLFPSFVLAGICSTESYRCKVDNQVYTRYSCSGDPTLPSAAFCLASKDSGVHSCVGDNSKQTEACNKEWLSSYESRKQNKSGTEPANVTRADIVNKIGSCSYKIDSRQTKIVEVKNGDCGTKKFICSFEAKCTRSESVTGQCFTSSGKCPADPIDCIAIRDLVGIEVGIQAIDSASNSNLNGKTNGASR